MIFKKKSLEKDTGVVLVENMVRLETRKAQKIRKPGTLGTWNYKYDFEDINPSFIFLTDCKSVALPFIPRFGAKI